MNDKDLERFVLCRTGRSIRNHKQIVLKPLYESWLILRSDVELGGKWYLGFDDAFRSVLHQFAARHSDD